jgi:hypothetical protein
MLFLAEPGNEAFGTQVPLRYTLTESDEGGPMQTLLVAFPRRPLLPNAEYVAVVRDTLRAEDGSPVAPSPMTRVALGLVPPASEAQAAIAGYEAPARDLLERQGIDLASVVRQTSFVTRTQGQHREMAEVDPRRFARRVKQGSVSVVIDSALPAEVPTSPSWSRADSRAYRTSSRTISASRSPTTSLPR